MLCASSGILHNDLYVKGFQQTPVAECAIHIFIDGLQAVRMLVTISIGVWPVVREPHVLATVVISRQGIR